MSTPTVSHVERARILHEGGLALERLHQPMATRPAPGRWSAVLVADRIEDAHRIIARLPMRIYPNAYTCLWPQYRYSFDDLRAQIETDELERLLKERNRVRIPPSPADIKAAEQALAWPLEYLREHPAIAKVVLLHSMWAVQGSGATEGCKRLGVPKRAFVRACMAGLNVIASGLNRHKVPVR